MGEEQGSARVRRLAHTVLMPGFVGTSPPPWLLDALAEGLGGVCYFGHNIAGPERTAALSGRIHHAGTAVIATDEEGGTVSRLHVAQGSPHVGAAVLGRADDLALTAEVARGIARDVRRAGIDLVLAPVVDVNSDPANPVIGVRSYGGEPDLVGRHAAAFVRAVQTEGVAACAKHFPGHGDTKVDTHAGLAVVDVDLATLRARELVPFAAAIAAGARCVMTAHIVFPALDEAPATLSAPLLTLLREELGFEGVVVSDAVDMRAISATIGFAEGVVRALAAGVDLVCLGNPALPGADSPVPATGEEEFRTALDAVLAAVRAGRLPLARLEEAAARVAALADWSRTRDRAGLPAPDPAGANDRAAREALHVRGPVAGALRSPVHVVDVRRRRSVVSGRISDRLTAALLDRLPGSTAEALFARPDGAEGRATEADLGAAPDPGTPAPAVPRADVILTGTPRADPAEEAALRRLLAHNPRAVTVCLGLPASTEDLPDAHRAVFTYGDSAPTVRAVTALLTD
ncbi:glycoside hydrolase family 3 N-terminal domain-containing protein [Streptomyces sp. NPDC049954]|uniref:glycoside hydrolase family 3 protein n=1 Tax=Streptomyces sp. NPDC049954 TaxID=3155779 RepID=UPI0034364CB4